MKEITYNNTKSCKIQLGITATHFYFVIDGERYLEGRIKGVEKDKDGKISVLNILKTDGAGWDFELESPIDSLPAFNQDSYFRSCKDEEDERNAKIAFNSLSSDSIPFK